jgi:L,D-peptidoglycan transpeptidase YkuD (ErfK/YbiS/YcfS/YnhG family)
VILRADTRQLRVTGDGVDLPCAIGRDGACPADEKREGDGKTPTGLWLYRGILLRPDRVVLPEGLRLPWRWLRGSDGWSDSSDDPSYNRPVTHPHAFSAERLWRDDLLYDVIVVLGHNDSPPVPGMGSAIFLHCWNDGASTEGCVALEKERLIELLPALRLGEVLEIR